MSNNQQTLSVVGGIIGGVVTYGSPYGVAIGSAIGGYVGASLDKLPDIRGPQLEDRKIQLSSYGVARPLAYGPNVRVAGNEIWRLGNALQEVANTDETGGKSGQPAQSTTIYSYYFTGALLLTGNETRSVIRLWAGGMLIYDGRLIDSVLPNFGLTFYRGTADQLPDPLIEAEKGVGNTPAYRGKSYLVFDAMPIEKTGWPVSITAELSGVGEFDITEEELGVEQDDLWFASAQRLDGNVIGAQQIGGTLRLSVLDQQTGAILLSVDHTLDADVGDDSSVCYVPPLNEVWVAGGTEGVFRFDGSTLEHLGDIFNGAGGGSSRMVWDPVRQRVFHRPNAQWLRAGGQNVVMAGAVSVADVINAERAGFIGLDLELGYEAMDAIVGSVPGTSIAPCAAAYDPMRRRYVVFNSDDDLYTVTDSTSPVVTLEAEGVVSDAINAGVFYDASTDCIVKLGVIVGFEVINIFDAETFEIKATFDGPTDPDNLRLGFCDSYPDTTTTGRVFVVGDYQPWAFEYFKTTLGYCVADLCERSGYEAGDIDVSDLTQTLRGYLISSVDSARPAIEQLASVFSFTAVEEDDKLVFKRRGSDPVATITRAECGAVEGEMPDEPPTAITKVRADQLDLPNRCFITAPDPARDLQPNTQQSQRQAASAGQPRQINVAVTLNADEAVRLANLFMYDAWTSRTPFEFSTDMRHTRLMPGDVVTLDGNRVLLLSRDSSDAVINWKGVSDDASVLTQYGTGIGGDFPRQVPPQLVPTYNVLLDIPLLSDAENTPGGYDGAWGIAPHWRGGVLYRSLDDGLSYSKVAVFPKPGVSIGNAIDALGDFAGGNIFDEINPLTVRMRNGTPYSATREALLAGGNALAIASGDGWEILQYRDVTTNGDGSHTLRGLLRGRLGTEWAMDGHAEGDVVVLLSESTLRDFAISASQIGAPQLIKAVSIGATLSDTESEEVTIDAERLKPLSPVDFRVARDLDNNATLSWKRRSRLSHRFLSPSIHVPVGEESEVYDVEILNATHTAVVRTFSGLTSPEVEYTAAQQDEDGLIQGSAICARIYQVSATVGRGHPLEDCGGLLASPIYVEDIPLHSSTNWVLRFVPQDGASVEGITIGSWDISAQARMEPEYEGQESYIYVEDGVEASVSFEDEALITPNGDASSTGDWVFSNAVFAFMHVGCWRSLIADDLEPELRFEFFSPTSGPDSGYGISTPDSFLASPPDDDIGPRNWDLVSDGIVRHIVRDQAIWDGGVTRDFVVKHSGLNFYRLNITAIDAVGDERPRIDSFQMYETVGGPDVCIGGFGDSNGASSEDTHGDEAFGGGGWIGKLGGPWWLRYEFAASTAIAEYGILVNTGPIGVAPVSWTFEVSPNGVDWTIADTRHMVELTPDVVNKFAIGRAIVAGSPP